MDVAKIARETGKSNLVLVRHLTALGCSGNVALKLVIDYNKAKRG